MSSAQVFCVQWAAKKRLIIQVFTPKVMTFAGFLLYLYLSHRKKKKKISEQKEMLFEEIKGVDSTITEEQWGQKKYDLSKYKDWDKD